MEDQLNELKRLLQKSEWTAEEMEWLLDYLENSEGTELIQIMQKFFSDDLENLKGINTEVSNKLLKRIHEKIDLDAEHAKPQDQRLWIRRIAIAASVIGLIALGTYLWFKETTKEIAQTTANKKSYREDIPPPTGNKAILTLADGTKIILDTANNGSLTNQGNTTVIKLSGKLTYSSSSLPGRKGEALYNTISTPRGGQYQIELPDGSQVWLNAASSLHFPTAFIGKERRVEITGEAYFEVTPMPSENGRKMPFIVSVNGAEVQVLGTHFNVMAYGDEDALKTTLLEGSVKFIHGANTNILKPGQQSQLLKNGNTKVISGIDANEVLAWKNGMFVFNNVGIETIMREIASVVTN